ncbi:MAG TPA: TlpA disulfide reductase family protein [Mucilaginibacter sp.]|nr:TlpA disulfide reductase family protein [Mucilaginibacter sp.]
MKNYRIVSAVAILSTLLLFSCKDNSVFTLSGTIVNPGSINKVYLLEADSTSISVVDSTNLSEDGNFKFKHNAPYANLFDLRIGRDIYDLIAKNGDQITFSANLSDTTHTYTIAGSDDSEKIKEFNRITNAFNDPIAKITDEYRSKAEKIGHETDSLISVYQPIVQKVLDSQSMAVLKFANDNKNSLAGFYAVTALDPNKYEQQMVAYADDLKGKFTSNPAVQRFERAMMEIKPVSVGHKAPDFTTMGIDGKPVKLSDYKGKYVLLDFWASWCAPCRRENPNVVKQYAIYNPKGLNILGISLDVDKSKWQQAIKHDKLVWRQASDLKNFEGPTEELYHITAIPSNFLIDPQGNIIAKNITGSDLEEFLNKTFNKPQ